MAGPPERMMGPSGMDGPPWPSGPPWGPGRPGGPGAWQGMEFTPLAPIAYLCAAVVAGSVMVRRFRPRIGFAAATLGSTAFIALGPGYGPIVLGPAVLLFTLASRLPPRRWVWWTPLLIPVFLAGQLDRPYLGLLSLDTLVRLVPAVAVATAIAAIGVVFRSRWVSSRLQREEEVRRSVYEERLRIAQEVHDVVGHSLSVINMQAGVALHVLNKRPDQIQPSLEAIRQTSKDALEELRGTLAVFRDPQDVREHGAPVGDAEDAGETDQRPGHTPSSGQGREPLPGLDRLDDLVVGIATAGRTVNVRTEGTPAALPAAVDHAAYRIVQEALTNVVRHAGQADATVLIRYGPTEVAVEITDNGSGGSTGDPGTGSGIAGMRERARAVGGRLTAGPRPEGGFAARAELPLGTGRGGQ
ncbi:sensor histidine kinase [Nocardiopsis gilva YIM 90087]|uniref:histidine kinase n=2 Tax=Nocardiopsis gilva TaxID=280236 RepID=A0A223SDF1_9ACTN|nr:sensor histidine kinase [Nocardiopsis gilva YIM 90087]